MPEPNPPYPVLIWKETGLGSLCLLGPFCVSENIYGFQGEKPLPALTFRASGISQIRKVGSLQDLNKGEAMAMARPLGSDFT